MKEEDLYPPLRDYLEKLGYDLYPEVSPWSGNGTPRADIVAAAWPVVTVVEMKKALNLDVIGQAIDWKGYANYIYVAVPKTKHINDHGRKLLHREGIGLLVIDMDAEEVKLWSKASFTRRIGINWHPILREYYKANTAGTKNNIISKYSYMMDAIRRLLEHRLRCYKPAQELVPFEDVLHCVNTHYANPARTLSNQLTRFEHTWCEKIRKDGKLFLRLKI